MHMWMILFRGYIKIHEMKCYDVQNNEMKNEIKLIHNCEAINNDTITTG